MVLMVVVEEVVDGEVPPELVVLDKTILDLLNKDILAEMLVLLVLNLEVVEVVPEVLVLMVLILVVDLVVLGKHHPLQEPL